MDTPEHTWNLDDLYASPQDPGISKDLEEALTLAQEAVAGLRALPSQGEGLAAALADRIALYEKALEKGYKPLLYASLYKKGDGVEGAIVPRIFSAGIHGPLPRASQGLYDVHSPAPMPQIPHTKAERIRATIQATRERRKGQQAQVYQLKLQNLSKRQAAHLERVFLESKWLYNWLLEDTEHRLGEDVGKLKEVPVKVGETYEVRELRQLGAQIKQEIKDRLKDNLRGLAQLKRKGHKVGRLRFKPFVNSIPLKQYGVTYKVDFERNRVRIQKLGSFRVLGLHQIPRGAELASAVLVRKPSGYYLHLVAFLSKGASPDGEGHGGADLGPVGLDLGLKHQLTLSNGLRFEYGIPPSRRVRRLQLRLSRKEKGSKNYEHTRHLLRREYERLNNCKRDIENKLLAYLKRYPKVAIQDDQVKGWQGGLFGKEVHATAIGGLKGRLKANLSTLMVLDPYETTSRECFRCGARLDLALQDRYIRCSCGWEADRDHNAALVILRKGLGIPLEDALGLDRPEVTPLEMGAAVRTVGSNPYVRISSVYEGGSPPL